MNLLSFFRAAAVALPVAVAAFAPAAFAQTDTSKATYPYAQSRPIPGRYIVVFKSSVTDAAAETARVMNGVSGQVRHTYTGAIRGFAASIPDVALPGIRNNPNVLSVEQDQTVALQQTSPENQATWGLDRIDQADLPLDTQYNFTSTGAGVNAFIIDTGIRADHTEFTGRVQAGAGFVADGNGTNDCNGHGTHVSGTVGGTTWGVAKSVSLIPVRVLDCSGSGAWSDVIAGIDWVANSTLRPAVANMSLGGGASTSVDAAVAGAVDRGVTMVVAAGNNNGLDACQYSPGREPSAITVGATANTDYRAYFSNTGTCVDLFAPGYNITSAWNTSPTASNTISGTSMASPHVAGVAALILQTNPSATPAAVTNAILSGATPNRVINPGTGSPNLLLNSLGGASAPVTQPSTVTVAFKAMAGSSTRAGGNWKASAVVAVRDVSTGASVANATVSGVFSVGGNASCVTDSAGSCTISSALIKSNTASSTTLTGTGITGPLMNYDSAQNTVTQIVIVKP